MVPSVCFPLKSSRPTCNAIFYHMPFEQGHNNFFFFPLNRSSLQSYCSSLPECSGGFIPGPPPILGPRPRACSLAICFPSRCCLPWSHSALSLGPHHHSCQQLPLWFKGRLICVCMRLCLKVVPTEASVWSSCSWNSRPPKVGTWFQTSIFCKNSKFSSSLLQASF